jgi:hypothetical protein
MSAPFETPPEAHEFGAFYAGYVARVGPGDILVRLAAQGEEIETLFSRMSTDLLGLRYSPGKWTPREVLGHLCDVERVMAYRALVAARADATPLPGFDENRYVENAGFDARDIRSLVTEFDSVRAATLSLLASLESRQWLARGVANDAPVTPRALAWIIAGHASHHLAILAERYVPLVAR